VRVLVLLFAALLAWGTPAAEPDKVRASSFVLLATPKLPEARAFRAELERRLDGRIRIDVMETDNEKVILLRLRGGTVMVGLIGAPLPAGQIDDLCEAAWYWRTACEATSQHQAQIFASVLGTDLDRLDANLLLTDVIAALMDENAIASYWGASLQSRESFLRQSATISRDAPPVWLWVNFRMSSDPQAGFSLSTQGMEDFGLREIEAKDVNRPGSEVFILAVGTAEYLISKGPVIRDGDTIGDSPKLNIRVHQGPSYWRAGATVYRITWPKD
jgi:hypothetical protein